MPLVDKEERKKYFREYHKKWYAKNREKVIARVTKTKKKNRVEWLKFKASLSCAHCGFSHPAVIDFHHVVRDGTKLDVNRLVGANCYARAYEEIKKCKPLCANCHRILHWDENPNREKI